MSARWFFGPMKWVVALGLIAGGMWGVAWVNSEMRAEREREGDEEAIQSPRRTKDGVVQLGTDEAARYGLEVASVEAVAWRERVTVYGQVVANPSATIEVRAPFAGTLRAEPGVSWPSPGQSIRSGQALGRIDIRIGAQERLGLEENLTSARLKKQGAEKVVQLQRERVNRVETVSRSQIVPGQQLDDAKVLLAEAETQMAIASADFELWRKALDALDRPGQRETTVYRHVLTAPADGEVAELQARPGMAVEAGSLVAQIVDFRRPLVRLDLPVDVLAAGAPAPVRITAISGGRSSLGLAATSSALSVEAVPVGPAPRIDTASQLVGYWYTIEAGRSKDPSAADRSISARDDGPGAVWRPGLQVQALLTLPGARSISAVKVGEGAVLFHQGHALVYVRAKTGSYTRREVRVLARENDAWILAAQSGASSAGVEPGEVVVRRGAQVLLSEEFRSDVDVD